MWSRVLREEFSCCQSKSRDTRSALQTNLHRERWRAPDIAHAHSRRHRTAEWKCSHPLIGETSFIFRRFLYTTAACGENIPAAVTEFTFMRCLNKASLHIQHEFKRRLNPVRNNESRAACYIHTHAHYRSCGERFRQLRHFLLRYYSYSVSISTIKHDYVALL